MCSYLPAVQSVGMVMVSLAPAGRAHPPPLGADLAGGQTRFGGRLYLHFHAIEYEVRPRLTEPLGPQPQGVGTPVDRADIRGFQGCHLFLKVIFTSVRVG